MAIPAQTTAGGAAPGSEAAAAVSPDEITAGLLAKHGAGEKLSQSEYGKLGAWKARLKSVFSDKTEPAGPSSHLAQTPEPGPGAEDLDPALIRRTTAAVLSTCDGIARSWIVAEARKAGADDATAQTFDAAARLQAGPRDLMIQTSPEVAAALGLDAGTYPIAAFVTGLGIWSGSILVAVNRLREMTLTQARNRAQEVATASRERQDRAETQFRRGNANDAPNGS